MKKLNFKHFKVVKLSNPKDVNGGGYMNNSFNDDGNDGTVLTAEKPKCSEGSAVIR